jgi:AcrR family transcriptional regulator
VNQGYEETTIDEIGRAAGVTGPAIYHHFKGKAHLFLAIVERVQEPLLAATESLSDSSLDPLEALGGMIAVWVDASLQTRALTLTYTHEHTYLDPPTRERVRAKYRAVTDMWMVVLGRVRPHLPEAERLAMVDSAFWLIRSQAFYRSALPPDRLAGRIRTMVLGALLANDDPGPPAGGQPAPPTALIAIS